MNNQTNSIYSPLSYNPMIICNEDISFYTSSLTEPNGENLIQIPIYPLSKDCYKYPSQKETCVNILEQNEEKTLFINSIKKNLQTLYNISRDITPILSINHDYTLFKLRSSSYITVESESTSLKESTYITTYDLVINDLNDTSIYLIGKLLNNNNEINKTESIVYDFIQSLLCLQRIEEFDDKQKYFHILVDRFQLIEMKPHLYLMKHRSKIIKTFEKHCDYDYIFKEQPCGKILTPVLNVLFLKIPKNEQKNSSIHIKIHSQSSIESTSSSLSQQNISVVIDNNNNSNINNKILFMTYHFPYITTNYFNKTKTIKTIPPEKQELLNYLSHYNPEFMPSIPNTSLFASQLIPSYMNNHQQSANFPFYQLTINYGNTHINDIVNVYHKPIKCGLILNELSSGVIAFELNTLVPFGMICYCDNNEDNYLLSFEHPGMIYLLEALLLYEEGKENGEQDEINLEKFFDKFGFVYKEKGIEVKWEFNGNIDKDNEINNGDTESKKKMFFVITKENKMKIDDDTQNKVDVKECDNNNNNDNNIESNYEENKEKENIEMKEHNDEKDVEMNVETIVEKESKNNNEEINMNENEQNKKSEDNVNENNQLNNETETKENRTNDVIENKEIEIKENEKVNTSKEENENNLVKEVPKKKKTKKKKIAKKKKVKEEQQSNNNINESQNKDNNLNENDKHDLTNPLNTNNINENKTAKKFITSKQPSQIDQNQPKPKKGKKITNSSKLFEPNPYQRAYLGSKRKPVNSIQYQNSLIE